MVVHTCNASTSVTPVPGARHAHADTRVGKQQCTRHNNETEDCRLSPPQTKRGRFDGRYNGILKVR